MSYTASPGRRTVSQKQGGLQGPSKPSGSSRQLIGMQGSSKTPASSRRPTGQSRKSRTQETTKTGGKYKNKKDEKKTEPELLYKMSLPCTKNCCYCVYTNCLGPVKLFVSQQGQEKQEELPNTGKSSKTLANKKRTTSVPSSLGRTQKQTPKPKSKVNS